MNLEGDMGRTVSSFRMLLEEIVMELSVFKRALRGEDKGLLRNFLIFQSFLFS